MTVEPEHDIAQTPGAHEGGESGGTPASSAKPRKASDTGARPEMTDGAPQRPDALPPAEDPSETAPELQDESASGEQAETLPQQQAQAPAAQLSGETQDDEVLLERDAEELAAKAHKADQYLELARRTRADFDNYRKRAAKEAAAAQDRGMVKLARELLPAVDNLDRALAAAEADPAGQRGESAPVPDGEATLVSGIKLVHAEVVAALARAGIERFSPEGERFDPERHEAVAQQPMEGVEPGTVVEVYQRGYRLGDSIIRPARVVVAG